ncbi:MAG: DNA polymerase III subunit gamma/tau [Clostridiales bacterium]|jgi:DNA polymerase-3 subunit gamma/tau|nr:DNA polymerase III subunit gamma/tau [Clostridiales bacterium]
MAYIALYRKLRPQTFSEVIGQQAIVRALKNQITSDRISHAYLFCGTRGTGKTSTAKIFARAVNCLHPSNGEPCNECFVCQDILKQRGVDVIEIDAASNNGVDNIRDIREEVKYPPTDCRYKVYIIDEVHMLSAGAFNALLKTLEEPPEHVIFVLATTDPQKLPATILSRCQRYDFRRISADDVTNVLASYMEKERVKIDADALRYIAEITDGAMRDALSLLDQCVSYYVDETIDLNKVLNLIGAVDPGKFFEFTESVYARNSARAMEQINSLVMGGKDILQFVSDMIQHFRNLMVAAVVEKPTQALDFSRERIELYRVQGRKIPGSILIKYVNNFSTLQSQLKYAANPRVLLEVAVIKLCCPPVDEHLEELYDRIEQLEKNLGQIKTIQSAAPPPIAARADVPPDEIPPAKKKAVPEDIQNVIHHWMEFINCFDNAVKALLKKCKPGYLEGDGLQIICPDPASKNWLMGKQNIILQNLAQNYHKDFNLQFSLIDDYDARHKRLYGNKDMFEELQSTLNIKISEWE